MIEVAKIKSLAKRINALMDERDGILADIRDIYAEAKSHEIVPKVLRKVIARQRAKDPAALILEDDLLDTYLAALDGPTRRAVEMAASGATAREIEAETGIDQATAARSVSLKKKRETNPAPINPEEGGAPNPVRDGEASADERDASASSSPPKSCGGVEGNASSADVRVEANAKRQTGVESGPQDTDDLTIPAFLRRASATVQP